jgi:hypothetical protein
VLSSRAASSQAHMSGTWCNAGPSPAARAKGALKRQRQAGTVLGGRAAKVKRREQLLKRGIEDEDTLTELTAAVGMPGVPFYVDRQSVGCSGNFPSLPTDVTLRLVEGEHAACDAVLAYHGHVCHGTPNTTQGREHALARGWAAPQQAFALAGRHASETRKCNLAVFMHHGEELVGMLAMSLDASARSCSVQAIHVALRVRGMQLPLLMWEKAKVRVAEIASDKHVRMVRFSLVLPCCQSQQGAHFWINRMGWDGTEQARLAAEEWVQGVKWKPGEYVLWYALVV